MPATPPIQPQTKYHALYFVAAMIGILLLQQVWTQYQRVEVVPYSQFLDDLKAGGYRVVQMRAKDQLSPLPEYDAIVMKEIKTPNVSGRPVESVVRTIEGN